MVYFSQHFFSDRKKKTLEYSLWFLSKFEGTMTSPKLFKKDIMQKPFLKGAEWRLFQRRSIHLSIVCVPAHAVLLKSYWTK